MSLDLYFIRVLEIALRAVERIPALRRALADIENEGKKPPGRGYRQWHRFIEEARPNWLPELLIINERGVIARVSAHAADDAIAAQDIQPGTYQVCLSTGRLLWSGKLRAEDVYWAQAFPSQPLRMAADTEGGTSAASREISMLEDSVILRVHPGIAGAALSVTIRWR